MKKKYISPEAEVVELVALEQIALVSLEDRFALGGTTILDTSVTVKDATGDY